MICISAIHVEPISNKRFLFYFSRNSAIDPIAAIQQFKKENQNKHQSEEDFKTDFAKDALATFYDVMDYIFREGFGTGSKTTENNIDGLAVLLFGK